MSNRANIEAIIKHMEKVGRHSRYTYDQDKCSVRKRDDNRTEGCVIHHVMWTFSVTSEPLASIRKELLKYAADASYTHQLFSMQDFQTYLDNTFWIGASKWFRNPSVEFDDMMTHLRERLIIATAADETVDAPTVAPAPEPVKPNDTVTLTYGFITMQLPADDPKVKELLAYIAKKLV